MNPYRRASSKAAPGSGGEPPRVEWVIPLAAMFLFVVCALRAWMALRVDGELRGESAVAYVIAGVSGYCLLSAAHRLLRGRARGRGRRPLREDNDPDPPSPIA